MTRVWSRHSIMDTTSKWFEYLHKERNLSEQVIRDAGLSVEKNRLRIPIFDEIGNELFAKYRRAPWSEDGPKYTYETGSSATLYGHNYENIGHQNYMVEGEMDVLAMRTIGYDAYTGTGGALTFKVGWLDWLPKRDTVILFDNDDTGIKGAIKLAKMLKVGTYKWIPPMYGKDVSDLLKSAGSDNTRKIIESQEGVTFNLISENQSQLKTLLKEMSDRAQQMEHCVGKQFLLQLIFDIKQDTHEKKPKAHHKNFDNAIDNARAYPMENLLQFRQRKAICPFHSEKTGSFHLYHDNHAFCHGSCNRAYDSIDVYRKKYGGTFLEAVDALNKSV